MSVAEREGRVEQIIPPEHKRLSYQLWAFFHQFVGKQTGQADLASFPDFTTEAGRINPEWLEWYRGFNKKVGTPNPGTLFYDGATKKFKPLDKLSPTGRIAALKETAQEVLTDHINTAGRKIEERNIRAELVGIFNGYAGIRFNLVRDVVNGHDFRGITLEYLASRDLRGWYQDLLRTRQQSVNPTLFDRWEQEGRNIQTPTRADWFFYTLFEELSKTPKDQLSSQTRIFKNLLSLPGSTAYREIADIFYGGDMLKTYKNLSAVAKMTGVGIPEGWQQFQGLTSEFRSLRQRLGEFEKGLDGYLNAADDLYGGDMLKTYINLSAVAKMTGMGIPEGWQAFQGLTLEFRSQRDWLLQNPDATVELFMQRFGTLNHKKALLNLAAIKNIK